MNSKFKTLSGLVMLWLITGCTEKAPEEQVTLDDYQRAAGYMYPNMSNLVRNTVEDGQWTNDSIFSYMKNTPEGREFISVNARTQEKTPAFNHRQLALALTKSAGHEVKVDSLPFRSFTVSESGNIEFSTFGKQYSFSPETGELSESEVTDNGRRFNRNEILSPDGKKAAFIKDHNLWVKEVSTGKLTQLTFDGKEDYGYATNNAGWTHSDGPVLLWSPNSDKIATFRQDGRGVGEMYLVNTKVGHPDLQQWKYPLPGDSAVFMIERLIVDLKPATPKLIRLQMDPDFQRSTTTDHIAGRGGVLLDAEWSPDESKFAFVSSSRDHKTAELKIADAQTGAVRSVLKETTPTYYESGVRSENWFVLHKSDEVIWYSERDNWGHLYMYDLNTGALKHQITKGEWQVQQVVHIDEDARVIYFTAGGKEEGNPYYQYMYKVDFDGENLVCLTPEKGDHNVTFSPDYQFLVDTYSTTANPPVSVLSDLNGKVVAELEKADISELKAAGWLAPIEFTVKARDGETDLYGIMCLPSNYDESKSYPILNYIYPGPQSGSIGDYSFRESRRDFQAVAELGFIVFGVDAMGTPGRSKSFHDAYYGNMGDNGLPDNIATIRQLAGRYPAIDTTRVGIWGHSGGGFASTDAILRYPDFYDVAVSGSGNHDNRNYEDDWGEKWQGLLKQNAEGINNYSDQANQLMAENLKGHLLITHGQLDDNVPPSNTMLVVEALIKANKDFDMIIFPNQRHGYGNMTNYMTVKRWDYFVKHLKGQDPPKDFSLDE
ncbi:S9 family peptidase [Robertkochia solimangrovi]|uniref:S9 family peptidase n=1 Tax=Robertkochia solimangrovi TaxID=2213046 RepID=UPI00117BE02E|nr:DPP IV N-terminal domain-containing protein [Robertkochia solimangrovi]TRZ41189.1 S9 family peptidase [Robertkochia solimangrovi]